MSDIKTFNVRLPHDIWLRLKQYSAESNISMNQYIVDLLQENLILSDKKRWKNKDNQ